MKNLKTLSLIATAIGLCATSHATTSYVKADATGQNNGTSWANAYTDLQTAIASNADTLWVANGMYKPTTTMNRTISFNFGSKKVFGGFIGVETLLSQRNYSTYQTKLSGDIGNAGINTDNSCHVVEVTAAQGLLDGFRIEGGNANIAASGNGTGGGLKMTGSASITSTIKNCLFTENFAFSGGAVANISEADVFLLNCRFENNQADQEGGALLVAPASSIGQTEVKDCIFYNNKAANGGSISLSGLVNIDRCTFSGNLADTGGAIYIPASPSRSILFMSNSLVVGNTAKYGGALYISDASNQAFNYAGVRYCTFSGNKSMNNSFALRFTMKSQLNNSIIWGNETGSSLQVNVPTGTNNNIIQDGANTINNTFAFDPLFINPGAAANAPFNADNYNYRCADASPAIDQGRALLTEIYDYDLNQDNRQFGVNPDLGCYEKTYCIVTLPGDIMVEGNDTTFCEGAAFSVKLTAPNGLAYNWSNGYTTDTSRVNTAGIYKVAVLNASGCRAIYSKTISLTPLPVPVIAQSNTTLTTGIFSTYQWIKGSTIIPGATSQTYTPTTSGTYKVKVINAGGCEGTSSSFNFTTLSIDEVNSQHSIHLYPNPAKDRFTLDLSALDGKVQAYVIYDIMGKIIMEQNKLSTIEQTLDVLLPESMANGTYIFKLYTTKEAYSLKFVVKR
jgi:hypothetical protein